MFCVVDVVVGTIISAYELQPLIELIFAMFG